LRSSRYALKYAIRVGGGGREQAPVRQPQFAVLVAVALVEDLGIGHREKMLRSGKH
jgi:hypothetical protein